MVRRPPRVATLTGAATLSHKMSETKARGIIRTNQRDRSERSLDAARYLILAITHIFERFHQGKGKQLRKSSEIVFAIRMLSDDRRFVRGTDAEEETWRHRVELLLEMMTTSRQRPVVVAATEAFVTMALDDRDDGVRVAVLRALVAEALDIGVPGDAYSPSATTGARVSAGERVPAGDAAHEAFEDQLHQRHRTRYEPTLLLVELAHILGLPDQELLDIATRPTGMAEKLHRITELVWLVTRIEDRDRAQSMARRALDNLFATTMATDRGRLVNRLLYALRAAEQETSSSELQGHDHFERTARATERFTEVCWETLLAPVVRQNAHEQAVQIRILQLVQRMNPRSALLIAHVHMRSVSPINTADEALEIVERWGGRESLPLLYPLTQLPAGRFSGTRDLQQKASVVREVLLERVRASGLEGAVSVAGFDDEGMLSLIGDASAYALEGTEGMEDLPAVPQRSSASGSPMMLIAAVVVGVLVLTACIAMCVVP